MPVVKLDALSGLAAAIVAAVPALAGRFSIQQAPSARLEKFPWLEIILPGQLTFDPAQRLLQQDLGGNVVVWNVGVHEGPLQLRVVATTTLDRATLEQGVLDVFMARDGGPGVLPVPIISANPSISWVAAFELESSQWMDQRAQEREYEAVITCNAVIPALTIETPVYDLDTLKLGITEDFTTAFDSTTFAAIPGVVVINQDGSISPA